MENLRLRKPQRVAGLAGFTPTLCDRRKASDNRGSAFLPKVSALLGLDIGLKSLLGFRLEV